MVLGLAKVKAPMVAVKELASKEVMVELIPVEALSLA
jgi:hypothetical protein